MSSKNFETKYSVIIPSNDENKNIKTLIKDNIDWKYNFNKFKE